MATTEILSGDISASLTFFLSIELIDAFRNVMSVSEVILLALLVAVLARAAVAWLERVPPGVGMLTQARYELRSLLQTVGFLASTSVVQLAVILVRSTVHQPASRLLTIVSSLLLLRIVLSSVRLQRRALTPRNE